MFKSKILRSLVLVFFGILTFLILAELILRLVGYIYVSNQDRLNKKSLQNNPDYIILALGESTTEMGGEDSWPKQLERILNEKIPTIKFSVINKGRSGTNSYKILSELEENLNEYKPDMVITMMGLNDGVTPDLKVYDEALSVNIEKPPYEENQSLLNQIKIYKYLKLFKVLIQRKLENLQSLNTIMLPVFASENTASNPELEDKITKDSENDYLHIGLGNWYMSQGRNEDAGREYMRALEINPRNYEAHVGIGNYYKNQTLDDKAEQMYRKAIEIDPQKHLGYVKLGIHLRDLGKYEESAQIFTKVTGIDSQSDEAYRQLAMTYRYWGKYEQAEKVLKDMLTIDPNNETNSKVAYYELENLYRQMGDKNKANEVYKKVLGVNSSAVSNHRKLKEVVLARGIKLVAVQYPTRNVETLKNLIGTDNVVFVDNEKIFLDALKTGKYEDYFTDRFAGDFGHATPKGNYLIASNVANVLIEKVFRKEFNLEIK